MQCVSTGPRPTSVTTCTPLSTITLSPSGSLQAGTGNGQEFWTRQCFAIWCHGFEPVQRKGHPPESCHYASSPWASQQRYCPPPFPAAD